MVEYRNIKRGTWNSFWFFVVSHTGTELCSPGISPRSRNSNFECSFLLASSFVSTSLPEFQNSDSVAGKMPSILRRD